MNEDDRVNEICREFDERAKSVGVTVARLELAEALARAEAAQHSVQPTSLGVCPHGVNLGNQVCSACEPGKFGGN